MKRKSSHRSAFFNLHIVIALVVFFTGVFMALFATAGPWEGARPLDAQVRNPNGLPFAPTGGAQQAWVARYDGPGNSDDVVAEAIAIDGSGNVYVTGESWGSGSERDYATIKYNSAGQQQWVARYNGPANSFEAATAIAVDGSGNVYVTGGSTGLNSAVDYATIKYNSAGQEQWVARYNGPGSGLDGAYAIALDNAGNVYVTGESEGASGYADYATIKYNSAGQEQWVARYNGPGLIADEAAAIAVDNLGNVHVTGGSKGTDGFYHYATIKYNPAGQEQWVARYNGPGNGTDYAQAIAVDGLGNVYLTGESTGSGSGRDYATIKYDSTGQEQWVARYNGPGNDDDEALALAVDGSSNVYVTGLSWGWYDDYATIKYNSAGQQQWVARYDGPGNFNDEADAIAVDGSGNVYVTGGSTGLHSGQRDYATIKYNTAGQEQWVASYNGPGNDWDAATAIAIDGSGNVYVTGVSDGSGSGRDYATIKYVQEATPTPTPTPTPPIASPYDFNRDNKPDFMLYNGSTRQTAVWYMHNTVLAGGALGPTLPAGWNAIDVADFNRDGNNDYALFNSSTRRTAIWYLSGVTLVGGAWGPTVPSGWALVATGDFNEDGKPDDVLYNASTHQTAIWYMNNNVFVSGAYGPTLPAGWSLAGVADFNDDGNRDYLLFNASTHQSAIWYLSGVTFLGGAYGPTIASGYQLQGTADFNGDGKPDYLLFNPSTRQTAIWYLNNNIFRAGAYGPTLPAGWNLVAP